MEKTNDETVKYESIDYKNGKYNDKKYLNVLDFIGNYKKAELGSRPNRVEFFINIDNDVYSAIKNKSALNGDDIVSISSILSKMAFFETVSGIIITIVSIARCINSLPAVEEVDRIRVNKAKYNIKNIKVKKK